MLDTRYVDLESYVNDRLTEMRRTAAVERQLKALPAHPYRPWMREAARQLGRTFVTFGSYLQRYGSSQA